jgi:hypothetical protein
MDEDWLEDSEPWDDVKVKTPAVAEVEVEEEGWEEDDDLEVI